MARNSANWSSRSAVRSNHSDGLYINSQIPAPTHHRTSARNDTRYPGLRLAVSRENLLASGSSRPSVSGYTSAGVELWRSGGISITIGSSTGPFSAGPSRSPQSSYNSGSAARPSTKRDSRPSQPMHGGRSAVDTSNGRFTSAHTTDHSDPPPPYEEVPALNPTDPASEQVGSEFTTDPNSSRFQSQPSTLSSQTGHDLSSRHPGSTIDRAEEDWRSTQRRPAAGVSDQPPISDHMTYGSIPPSSDGRRDGPNHARTRRGLLSKVPNSIVRAFKSCTSACQDERDD
ncbi:hypothetical protein IAU59_001114 [Kwoniella sp. CBS 9459]